MNTDHPTRVALVEDHALFAEALATALRLEGFEPQRIPLDTAHGSLLRLVPDIVDCRPRVVMLDLDLGSYGNGLDLVRPLTEAGLCVLMVTSNTDHARWGECIAHGARKVIPKYAALTEIITAIQRIVGGLPTMTPEEREELLTWWRRQVALERGIRARLARLTQREAEVLGMLMAGLQVQEIARQRFVSESTVRTQVKAVLAKLQVGSQLTAVGLAYKAHWEPPEAARQVS